MNPIVFIIGSVLLGACAQLVMKSGASRPGSKGLLSILTRPATVAGLTLNALAAALWIISLRSVDLSYAFPWLSLNFILVPLGAALFYGEQITGQKVVGMLGITIGLAIVAVG